MTHNADAFAAGEPGRRPFDTPPVTAEATPGDDQSRPDAIEIAETIAIDTMPAIPGLAPEGPAASPGRLLVPSLALAATQP